MALGAILGRFGAQVGGQVGAKLGRKSEKWRFQDDVKKCVVQNERRCTQVYASVRNCTQAGEGGSPIINQSNTPRTTPWALEHSPRAQGPAADMYMYMYMYMYIHISKYMYIYICIYLYICIYPPPGLVPEGSVLMPMVLV